MLFKASPDKQVENQQPISIIPLFNGELRIRFYAVHILLIVQAIELLEDLFFDMYNFQMPDELNAAINIVYTVLIQTGWLVEDIE